MKLEEFKRKMEDKNFRQYNSDEMSKVIAESVNRCTSEQKTIIFMEELSELSQMVSKCQRYCIDNNTTKLSEEMYLHLVEEIADVNMILEMIGIKYDVNPIDVRKAIDIKIDRERLRNNESRKNHNI